MKNTYLLTSYVLMMLLCSSVYAVSDSLVETPGKINKVDRSLYRYIINVTSTKNKSAKPRLPVGSKLEQLTLYRTRASLEGKKRYRWRLGFFVSRTSANKALALIQEKYKSAWLDVRRETDSAALDKWLGIDNSRKKPEIVKLAATGAASSVKNAIDTDALMKRAAAELVDKKYRVAIGLYNRILRAPEDKNHMDALELLGLAREKNRQLAHAKSLYRRYLKKYPDSDGAKRVKLRLDGILTARLRPRDKLKVKKQTVDDDWKGYGSLSQYYRRDITIAEQVETERSSLSSNFNYTARRRGEIYDMRTQFSVTHVYDFDALADNHRSKISTLYYDIADHDKNLSARVGRQSSNKGGVLGRMDGLALGYRMTNTTVMNLVAGYPVLPSTSSTINDNSQFYGINFDLGTYAEHWDFNVFGIKQYTYDLLDRQAVGGELRYLDSGKSVFTSVDYDTSYDELNTFFFVGNWRYENNATLNLTLNYRKSPILTTRNALQGQGVSTLAELILTTPEEQIRQLAVDRSADYRSATLSSTYPLSEKYMFNGEVTVSNISDTVASGGVEAQPGTGNEYFFTAQLIGSNVFKEGDTTIYEVRYYDTSTSDRTSFGLSSRYPFNKDWRIRPRIRLDSQERNDGTKISSYEPSARLEYRMQRNLKFELEGGYKTTKTESVSLMNNGSETNTFVYLGYVYDF